jgi:hypothetical protein
VLSQTFCKRRLPGAFDVGWVSGDYRFIEITTASPPRLSIRPVRLAFRCRITPAPFCIHRSPPLAVPMASHIGPVRRSPRNPRGRQAYRRPLVSRCADATDTQATDGKRVSIAPVVQCPGPAGTAADIGHLHLSHVHGAVRRQPGHRVWPDLDGGLACGEQCDRETECHQSGLHSCRSCFNAHQVVSFRMTFSDPLRFLLSGEASIHGETMVHGKPGTFTHGMDKPRATDRALTSDYLLSPISALIRLISASSSALSTASVSWMATFFRSPVNLNGT